MSGAGAETTALPGVIRAPLSVGISLPGGRTVALESLVIRPDRPGRLPLVVLVHGTPRTEPGTFLETYRGLSPTGLADPAMAFVRHGYATVSILRRGFGRSEGPYAERIADCDKPDYLGVGRVSAEDVRGAVASLRREPWVDPERILLLGHSSGGFAIVAAGAENPPGVIGVLNFAGGKGAFKPDQVCNPNRLVGAFAAFGRTARIPELWLFAENDHYFSPALARRMFDAYTAAGAPAQLKMLPPFGSDGHLLLSRGSTDLWWPSAAAFLVSLHLPVSLEVELPPPNYGSVAYEDAGGRYGLSRNHDSQLHADEAALHECAAEKCKIVFRVGPHQCGAIALTEDGKVWGGAVRPKRDAAELAAMGNCQKLTGGRCKVRGADCNE